jgi:hypothetical protein
MPFMSVQIFHILEGLGYFLVMRVIAGGRGIFVVGE